MSETPPTNNVDEFGLQLGVVIRERRTELGLRLVEVAEQTGLSHSFLSQLERGKTRASMRSLFAIASALQTTQEQLLARATPGGDLSGSSPRVAESPVGPANGGSISKARLLMHTDSQLDITEFVGLPFDSGEFFQHARPEFIYVVSGRIEFEMRASPDSGATVLMLEAGQSVTCPGGMHHRYRSSGEVSATVLMVHYPA